MGLTRAFMYAGAPTVGVSLWSVADKSTADLHRNVGESAANIHADAHITRLCTHYYAFPIAAA